jgi:hypothetical protein
MYTLFSPESELLERIRGVLSAERGVTTSSWRRFESLAPRAQCLVLASRRLSRDVRLPLGEPIVGDAAPPLIVVTTREADNTRRALHSGAAHVVWLNDVERELHPLLCAMRARFVLDRAADVLEASAVLPTPLRAVLAFACRAERPIHSVSELSSLLGRNRKTLWRYWNSVNGAMTSLRLEDFLDWILVIHAAHRKTGSRSWAQVATALGTHEHTLARMLTRLTATKLGDVRCGALEARFVDAAVRPLAGAPARRSAT